MVVVNMVDIDREASHGLSNALIPSRIIDSRIEIVHTCWIRVLSCLATEHWGIHEHESDVSKLVVLHLDFVCPSKDRDINRQSRCVNGIIEAIRAWNHPNEVLILKILSHQLSHDSKATNLDLNVPIRN